ncbi:MAG: glucose-1-phosphate thymidylyltransferase [Abditibacteriota bacterium]|nr:glucose-1-phosphate thymidylyltransferase [Abditibacteriota bacterium]MBP5093372.1 glucose-1-phosphate thymidylyltransferase [Abditibacteriota bacterium]
MLKPEDFFDLTDFDCADIFDGCEFVWDALKKISVYLLHKNMSFSSKEQRIKGVVMRGAVIEDDDTVHIGEGTVVEPGAFIRGPVWIGKNCKIRHGAYLREDVIVGDNCVVGHGCELKNVIMLPTAQCPHLAYVGDSILGRHTNLGAGTIVSNLQLYSEKDPDTGKRPPIILTADNEIYDTDLAKFGAIVGDGAQTGCNTTLNPGCLMGKNTVVYPNVSLPKGYYPEGKVIKHKTVLDIVDKHDIEKDSEED